MAVSFTRAVARSANKEKVDEKTKKPLINYYVRNSFVPVNGVYYQNNPSTGEVQNTLLDYRSQYKYGAKNMKEIEHNMNMTYDSESHLHYRFDKLYSVYPQNEMQDLRQWVFMVRPDLNLLKSNLYLQDQCTKDKFIRYMNHNHKHLVCDLTRYASSNHDFIAYLVGRTESIQIPDYGVKVYNITQPYSNLAIPYAGHGLESLSNGTFDIQFREDKDASIHKLFQLWLYYIDKINLNQLAPSRTNIQYNIIDYATSVYVITCAPDGKSILFWSKYTGAIPTSVPNSDFSFNRMGESPKTVTIPFSYYHAESLNPEILMDFNVNAGAQKPNQLIKKVNDYDADNLGLGYALKTKPFIYRNGSTGYYELRWLG